MIRLIPRHCSDMHDPCPNTSSDAIAYGDQWLSTFLPTLTNQPQYKNGSTAIFITWDEDEDNGGNNQIPTLVLSPYTPAGTTSSTMFNHYSMLHTAEQLLNLGFLGGASSAHSMVSDFNLDGSLATSSSPGTSGSGTESSSSGTGYSPSSSAVDPNQKVTAVTLTSPANPVVTAKSAQFSAVISAVSPGTPPPSGFVTWDITSASGANVPCRSGNDAVRKANGLTKCAVAPRELYAADGPYTVSVNYPGGGVFTSSSAALTQPVSKGNSRTRIRVSPPASTGGTASIIAVVGSLPSSAGTPTGTVTFSVADASGGAVPCVAGNTVSLTSDTAMCEVGAAFGSVGPYNVTATYSGDGNFNASTSNSRTIDGPRIHRRL
jgi:hypothetical protein